MSSTRMSAPQPDNYYSTVPGFPQYDTTGHPTQMSQQVIDDSGVVGGVSHAPSTSSPIQYQQPVNQQVSAAHNISNNLHQASTMGNISNPSFEASLFDPNDPTLFNFNPSDFNFGNHYGALEFGMLGHMTSGAVNTPEMEVMDSMNQSGSFSYDGTTGYPVSSFPYTQSYQPWQTSGSRQGSTNNLWALHHNGMDAFAVADTTPSLSGTSPNSQSQDWTGGYSSNTVSPEIHFVQPDQNRQQHYHRHRQTGPFPNDFGPTMSRKAQRRDTKQIYAAVTKGYPYTQRFHSLTAFLHKRFTTPNVLRIAEAMAAIRPSFINLTKGLSDDDLIFMEQGFQRQLVDYDDTWQQTGTPSIICRRTGEVVSCNKEFSLVTGWRRDVLLGKEPNLNVNFDNTTSGSHTGSSSRGAVTPRIPNVESDATLPQPVFIAELLDQDSAVGFWEDFAERAFGASTSSMPGVTCTLMKYKTKDDPGWGPGDRLAEGGQRAIKTESGTTALGERDGRLDMSMTWLVRRDMFDIPMMIVINVSTIPRSSYTQICILIYRSSSL